MVGLDELQAEFRALSILRRMPRDVAADGGKDGELMQTTEEEYRRKNKERAENLRQRYISQGLCAQCGKPQIEGSNYCRKCLDAANERQTAYQKARMRSGKCAACGRRRLADGNIRYCDVCRERINALKRKYRRQSKGAPPC